MSTFGKKKPWDNNTYSIHDLVVIKSMRTTTAPIKTKKEKNRRRWHFKEIEARTVWAGVSKRHESVRKKTDANVFVNFIRLTMPSHFFCVSFCSLFSLCICTRIEWTVFSRRLSHNCRKKSETTHSAKSRNRIKAQTIWDFFLFYFLP